MTLPLLHLASQSPRRKQLLEALGLPFRVVLPESVEEHPSPDSVEAITLQNAREKANSIATKLRAPEDVALGADTLVVLGDRVLGKPRDEQDAVAMLEKLSGQTQTVITGLALVSPRHGFREIAVRTQVKFRKLAQTEIRDYCRTREPYDKAGAYAVQGMAALFIESIDGSYTNVMGLPIEALMIELSALTRLPIHQWFQ